MRFAVLRARESENLENRVAFIAKFAQKSCFFQVVWRLLWWNQASEWVDNKSFVALVKLSPKPA